jgi:hypothetical protein
MNELILPWPDRSLHPNARVHWAVRAANAKRAKTVGFIIARQAGLRALNLPEGDIHVHIEGYLADRRRRDADGLLSSLKSAMDGIAESIGVDDRRFIPHPRVMPEVRKGGEVRIRLEAA